MSNGWLMHIPCFSTTMTWPCLKYMAHFPSPTFSRAYDNQYVLYCCNISQGGQGWCFSPDDSGIVTSHRAGKVDVFHRMILASTPSRGPFVVGVRPMPQSLPPRAPLWTSPLRRHAVAASVAAGPSCRSATCAGQPCERCAQCEQHSAAWLELFRSFVEDTRHTFISIVCM